jgi:hypothetical protein
LKAYSTATNPVATPKPLVPLKSPTNFVKQ